MADWISVKDGLPRDGVRVLVLEDGAIELNYIPYAQSVANARVGRFMSGHDYVTHWMYLPKPPSE